ncbi:MAG: hypothetical protein UW68_C0026G0009 [Candidatus Collierbacteria bacterium GW2011_GWB1_44_6]|uniref:Uncharacterized protein n=1 Tax=Candidatus Collierbacteria bacterium GW2011_GWB1_44_6 TaxID=1618384 RepID=A0A0G1JN16_9BACT|nr:MAG: hypothetical protein UW68_C0026G0009 [Candidatus Collierbacteria bacterium GW2011_GWB1_44_6]
MAEILGKEIEFGVALESVRGTAKTTAEKWFKKITATVVEKVEKKVDESTRNRLEDSLATRIVKKWIEGELSGNVHVDGIGYLFYSLYGGVTSTLVVTGVYSHVFAISNSNLHPCLSLFAKDGANSQEVYNGGMVSDMELNVASDDYLKFKANFIARSNVANSASVTYGTEYDLIGKDVVVKIATTEAGLSSATAIKVKELSIKWDQGLIVDQVVGSLSPNDLFASKMAIEGELKLNYDADTYKDLFNTDVYRYMQITITGTADLGTTNYPTITILMHRVAVTDWTRDDSAGDLVSQTVSFKAFFNETDVKQSTVTIKNKTAEYDTNA